MGVKVIRIDDTDYIAAGQPDTFVHSVVQSFVRLAHNLGNPGYSATIDRVSSFDTPSMTMCSISG